MAMLPIPGLEGEMLSTVVVMGVTGAGKSHFINKLAGKTVTDEGESLSSYKSLLGVYQPRY